MLILFLLILIDLTTIESSHFNGGAITWFPVDPSTNSSPIIITITQSYSWTYPSVKCDINVPMSTGNSNYNTVNLTCVSNCTTDGGYSAEPISILTDCTSASSSMGIMTSQRSVNISLTAGAHFTLAYIGTAWRKLGNTNVSNPGWSIACLIDLRRRPDGLINTPPVSSVASPQYVIVNRTTQIKIPITDVNEGDDLRCRWAVKNSSATSANECGDVCYPTGLPSGTTLSNCTLTFTGLSGGTWYAISLQIEDFINTTSTTAMSSVPVQFLIYVMTNLSCTQSPIFLPLTNCFEVQVGTPVNLTLFVMNQCNQTKTIITDITNTVSISGMQIGNLTNSTTNVSLSYVTLNWTPQTNQIGSQQFCAIAYTNEKVQSEEYCVTFNVNSMSSFCQTTTTTSTSTSTTTSTSTSTTTSTTTTKTTTSTGTTSSTTSLTTTSTTTTKTTTSTTTTTSTATTTTTTQTTTSTTTSVTTTSTTTTKTTTSTTTTTSTATTTTTTQTTTSTTTSVTTTSTTTTKTTTSTTTKTTTSTTTKTTTSTTTTTSTATTTTTTQTTTSTTTSVTTTSTTTTQTTTSTSITSTTTVTTTTTTVTTTTSSVTTTTTTATTTTVTTTTSVTSTTTTSITSTTQTTTTTTTATTSKSNQINIPLIVGLSLLALLVALCCSFYWFYSIFRKSSARHRTRNRLSENFKQQKYSVSNQKFKTKNTDRINLCSSNELTQSLSLSTNDNQTSIKDKKRSTSDKRPKSKHFAVNIHPLNKTSDSLESKEDQQNKSNSASLNKITVIKLSKKEASKSSHNQSNEDLKINNNTKSNEDTSIHINNQSFTNTEKSNTIGRRNSIHSAVTVTKIKQTTDDTKVIVDQTKSNPIPSSNGNKRSTTRVTRISSKQKRSTIRLYQSNN